MAITGPYSRVKVEGKTLNRRTAAQYAQIKRVYKILGGTGYIYLNQGSYNGGGVAASGGTHDGGGAIDMGLSVKSQRNWNILQKAARMCMLADWDRPPLYRNGKQVWGHHNHGISIGDREASYSAKNQVAEYYRDGDGLVGSATDDTWKPRVLFPGWYPIYNVSLSVSIKEAKRSSNYIPRAGVKRIQRALNLKLGTALKVDGKFGKQTKAAYKRWEQSFPNANADGIPGLFTLTLLGAGCFNVSK